MRSLKMFASITLFCMVASQAFMLVTGQKLLETPPQDIQRDFLALDSEQQRWVDNQLANAILDTDYGAVERFEELSQITTWHAEDTEKYKAYVEENGLILGSGDALVNSPTIDLRNLENSNPNSYANVLSSVAQASNALVNYSDLYSSVTDVGLFPEWNIESFPNGLIDSSINKIVDNLSPQAKAFSESYVERGYQALIGLASSAENDQVLRNLLNQGVIAYDNPESQFIDSLFSNFSTSNLTAGQTLIEDVTSAALATIEVAGQTVIADGQAVPSTGITIGRQTVLGGITTEDLGTFSREVQGLTNLTTILLGDDNPLVENLQTVSHVAQTSVQVAQLFTTFAAGTLGPLAFASSVSSILGGGFGGLGSPSQDKETLKAIQGLVIQVKQLEAKMDREFAKVNIKLDSLKAAVDNLENAIRDSTRTIVVEVQGVGNELRSLKTEIETVQEQLRLIQDTLGIGEINRVYDELVKSCSLAVIIQDSSNAQPGGICKAFDLMLVDSKDPRFSVPPLLAGEFGESTISEADLIELVANGSEVNRFSIVSSLLRSRGVLGTIEEETIKPSADSQLLIPEGIPHPILWSQGQTELQRAIEHDPKLAVTIPQPIMDAYVAQGKALEKNYYDKITPELINQLLNEYLNQISILEQTVKNAISSQPVTLWGADPSIGQNLLLDGILSSDKLEHTLNGIRAFECSQTNSGGCFLNEPLQAAFERQKRSLEEISFGDEFEFREDVDALPETAKEKLVSYLKPYRALELQGLGMIAAKIDNVKLGKFRYDNATSLFTSRYEITHTFTSEDPRFDGMNIYPIQVFVGASPPSFENEDKINQYVNFTSKTSLSLPNKDSIAVFSFHLNTRPTAPVEVGIFSGGPFDISKSVHTFTEENYNEDFVVSINYSKSILEKNLISTEFAPEETGCKPAGAELSEFGQFYCMGRGRRELTADLSIIWITEPPNPAGLTEAQAQMFAGRDNELTILKAQGPIAFNIRQEYVVFNPGLYAFETPWPWYISSDIIGEVNRFLNLGKTNFQLIPTQGLDQEIISAQTQRAFYKQVHDTIATAVGSTSDSTCRDVGDLSALRMEDNLPQITGAARQLLGRYLLLKLLIIERFGEKSSATEQILNFLKQLDPAKFDIIDPCETHLNSDLRQAFHKRGQVFKRTTKMVENQSGELIPLPFSSTNLICEGGVDIISDGKNCFDKSTQIEQNGEMVPAPAPLSSYRYLVPCEEVTRDGLLCIYPSTEFLRNFPATEAFKLPNQVLLEGGLLSAAIEIIRLRQQPIDPVSILSQTSNPAVALLKAAFEGNLKEMSILIVREGIPATVRLYGYDAYMMAARGGHIEALALLEHLCPGCWSSTTSYTGETALIMAAYSGDFDTVRTVVSSHNLFSVAEASVDESKVFSNVSAAEIAQSRGFAPIAAFLRSPSSVDRYWYDNHPSRWADLTTWGAANCNPKPILRDEATQTGSGRISVLDLGATNDDAFTLLNGPNGSVYVVGTCSEIYTPRKDVFVARMSSGGDLDTTYGTGGVSSFALPLTNESLITATKDSSERLYLGIWQDDGSGDEPPKLRIARLTEGGERDTEFGEAGFVNIPLGDDVWFSFPREIAIATTANSVYVTGSFRDDVTIIEVLKLNENGEVASEFGLQGRLNLNDLLKDTAGGLSLDAAPMEVQSSRVKGEQLMIDFRGYRTEDWSLDLNLEQLSFQVATSNSPLIDCENPDPEKFYWVSSERIADSDICVFGRNGAYAISLKPDNEEDVLSSKITLPEAYKQSLITLDLFSQLPDVLDGSFTASFVGLIVPSSEAAHIPTSSSIDDDIVVLSFLLRK